MSKVQVTIVAAFIATALWIAPALGQGGDVAPEPVAHELAAIRQSLTDLVTVMSAQQRNDEARLILRRIEMHDRRLEPLEREYRVNQRERSNYERIRIENEEFISQTKKEIARLERDGPEAVPQHLREDLRHAEDSHERHALSGEVLESFRIELENEIEERRDVVDALEDALQGLID